MYSVIGVVEVPQETLGLVVAGTATGPVAGTFPGNSPGLIAGERAAKSALALRRIGGKPWLEWLIRRASEAQQLQRVIVTMPAAQGAELRGAVPTDIAVYAGAERDNLSRLAAALKQFPAHSVVRIQVENPFVDPALIDRLATSAQANGDCDYATYCCSDGRAAVRSRLGLFAEWIRADAVFRADAAAKGAQRNDLTQFILSHPEMFPLRLLPVPTPLDRDDLRLAIQVEEDWDHALTILDALGLESLEWQRIAGLLDRHPAIRQRMAVLNAEENA